MSSIETDRAYPVLEARDKGSRDKWSMPSNNALKLEKQTRMIRTMIKQCY